MDDEDVRCAKTGERGEGGEREDGPLFKYSRQAPGGVSIKRVDRRGHVRLLSVVRARAVT